MTTDRFEELEKQTHILQEMTAAYHQESPQYAALQNAAFALIFAITEQYETFVQFIHSSQEELSDEQKESLRKMGITL
jgi:hypothetical protein